MVRGIARISLTTLVVRDYDEALAFYVGKLGFTVTADNDLGAGKRWLTIAPSTHDDASTASAAPVAGLLLAKAATPAQLDRVGDQTGGRVFLFLQTGEFRRDYARFKSAGVHFLEEPRIEAYGTVAVFEDLYGNKLDLIELASTAGPKR